MNKYIVELIGTFFLVLVIGLTGNPIAIGAILMVMVYMGGHISGAHYNPAVSLAILIRGKINGKDLVMYTLFQIIGALLGALACYWIMNKTFFPAPAPDSTFIKSAALEVLFTFALVSVVLNVATTRVSVGTSYFGLAIGFTVLAGAFAVGPITGGAFNPAVGLGPILVDAAMGGTSMKHLPIYLIGPYLGAVIAAIVFKFTNPEEFID